MSDRPTGSSAVLPPYLQAIADDAANKRHLPGFEQIHSEFSTLTNKMVRNGITLASAGALLPDHSLRVIFKPSAGAPGDDWEECPVPQCPGKRPPA